MPLALDILNNIYGYSKAKYATWFYYRPDHLLFDVGEGISVCMGNALYGIESIFISHGHGDHIGGLVGLLRSRASSMGDIHKPLTIWFPKGDRSIYKLRNYIREALGELPFKIGWHELRGDEQIPLAHNRFLRPFPSCHQHESLTMAYAVVERRARLKPEFAGLSSQEIVALIREQGRDYVQEQYHKNLLIYSGDTMPLPVAQVSGAEVLIHDATFIVPADREEQTHATLAEVFQLADRAQVGALALFHFSSRYRRRQVLKAIRELLQEHAMQCPVFYMYPPSYPAEFKRVSPED